jgi:hypothetical protein
MSGRTIVIGDVHGCADELDALCDRIGPTSDDRVLFVGDLVVRGPEPKRVLATVRRLGARSVRGNHEDRLLRWRFRRRWSSPAQAEAATTPGAVLQTAVLLGEEDWELIGALPLWIDLPEEGLLIVHAGLEPGVPLAAQSERTLLACRSLGDRGEPLELRDAGVPWGSRWQGPPHVVFGHNALSEPQLHAWATGLDTGCVYGGALTALVLPEGAAPPPPDARAELLVHVPARKAYASS